ncbi:hypothetical protein PAEN110709_29730 [Paenibacillus endophyticus]
MRLQQPTRTRLRLRLQLRGCGVLSVLLQMGFTRNIVTYAPRGLLHHGSTLTCTGIKPAIGGPFLWHYPSARADWTLSSILPCGARTFLSRQQRPPAIVCQTFRGIVKYTSNRAKAQPSNDYHIQIVARISWMHSFSNENKGLCMQG